MPQSKVAYVAHVPGHKNSKGEAAPWVIKDHKDDHIISSFGSEAAAKEGLRNMHAHEGSAKTAKTARPLHLEELRAWARSPEEGRAATKRIDAAWKPDPKYVVLDALEESQKVLATLLTGKTEHRITAEIYLAAKPFRQLFTAEKIAAQFGKQAGNYFIVTQQLFKELESEGLSLSPAVEGKLRQVEARIKGLITIVNSVPDRSVTASTKTAVYIEEQWEDILQKKGYVIDEGRESDWNDTLYTNPSMPDISVMLHEGGGDASYYVVEVNNHIVEQGEDPETLWNALDKAVQIYRESIKHDREFNEEDKSELKSMGIIGNKKAAAKFDYEASGNDVVLITPENKTELLEGDAARNFWVALDHLENKEIDSPEFDAHLQQLIQSAIMQKVGSYRIRVDASKLLKKAAAQVYIAGVEYKDNRVEKLKFTSNHKKAMWFTREAALGIRDSLPEFKISGGCFLIKPQI